MEWDAHVVTMTMMAQWISTLQTLGEMFFTETIRGSDFLTGNGSAEASGKLTKTPWTIRGAAIINITNKTNITSI